VGIGGPPQGNRRERLAQGSRACGGPRSGTIRGRERTTVSQAVAERRAS
jgi:hypothetical protein